MGLGKNSRLNSDEVGGLTVKDSFLKSHTELINKSKWCLTKEFSYVAWVILIDNSFVILDKGRVKLCQLCQIVTKIMDTSLKDRLMIMLISL